MTNPQGIWGGQDPSMYEFRLKRVEAELQALRERGTRDVGALSVKNPAGVITLFSGPSSVNVNPDGSPQWVTYLRDAAGIARLAFYDPLPLTDGFIQVMWEWDHLGSVLRTSDRLGGWAEPWFSFTMYPFMAPPAGVYSYMGANVNVAEQTLWEGRIGYMSHPYIGIDVLGGASSGTNTTRYRLKVNGTTINTWDVVGLGFFGTPTLAIGAGGVVIGSRNVGVQLTAQSLSGSGSYACQIYGTYMRQTP